MRRPATRVHRCTTFLLILLHVSACSGWHTQQAPAPEVLASKQPPSVRVIEPSGRKTVLLSPKIQNDSLLGIVSVPGAPQRYQSMALEDVWKLQVEGTDWLATTGFIVGVGFLALSVLSIFALKDFEESFED